MEDQFIENGVGDRARPFCMNAVDTLVMKCSVKEIALGGLGYTVLFADVPLRKIRELVNGAIALRRTK